MSKQNESYLSKLMDLSTQIDSKPDSSLKDQTKCLPSFLLTDDLDEVNTNEVTNKKLSAPKRSQNQNVNSFPLKTRWPTTKGRWWSIPRSNPSSINKSSTLILKMTWGTTPLWTDMAINSHLLPILFTHPNQGHLCITHLRLITLWWIT